MAVSLLLLCMQENILRFSIFFFCFSKKCSHHNSSRRRRECTEWSFLHVKTLPCISFSYLPCLLFLLRTPAAPHQCCVKKLSKKKKRRKQKFHLSKTDIAKCNAHCSNNGRENPFPSRFSLRRYSNFEFFFIFIPIFVVVLRKFSLRKKKEGNFVYTFLGLVAWVGKREKFVVCSPPSRFRNTFF